MHMHDMCAINIAHSYESWHRVDGPYSATSRKYRNPNWTLSACLEIHTTVHSR